MYHVNANLMVEIIIKIKTGIMINVDVNVKNIYVKNYKTYIWNPATYNCEKSKYLVPVNFNEKKQPVKHKFYIFYLNFN